MRGNLRKGLQCVAHLQCSCAVPTAAGEVTCFLVCVSCSARICCHFMSAMFRGADRAGMLPAVQQLNVLED